MSSVDWTTLAPFLGAAAGVGSLAALLLLHRLRPQQRSLTVATLIFFRQARAAHGSRVLGGRFSRRWTFLLLLALCALIAAAIGLNAWRTKADADAAPAAIVLDAGCELTATASEQRTAWQDLTDRCRVALSTATADDGPAVILAADVPRLIADVGTPRAVAAERLLHQSPAALPSRPASALLLAQDLIADRKGNILWLTTAPSLPPELPPLVCGRIILDRLPLPAAAVISAVLFQSDPHDPTRGRLLVRVAASDQRPLRCHLAARRTSQPQAMQRIAALSAGNEAEFDDIPAAGAAWTVELVDAAGARTEQSVQITVPRREPRELAFDDATPLALRQALATLFPRGSKLAGPDIAAGGRIRVVSDASGFAEGGLCVVEDSRTTTPRLPLVVTVPSPAGGATAAELEASIAAASGLRHLPADSVPLLRAGAATVAAYVPLTANRPGSLLMSSALFDDRSDFTRRASFVLFVQQACDRLGWIGAASPVVVAPRIEDDPAWAPDKVFAAAPPPVTVVYQLPPRPATEAASAPAPLRHTGSILRPSEWLLAAALTLMTVEGALFARRKVV